MEVARGQYLATIMDCGGLPHAGSDSGTPRSRPCARGLGHRLRAAGRRLVYPKNLTPDLETGLGRWSLEEFARAIRQGQSRNGRVLFPVMPWPSDSALSDSDARAIAAYLKALPPIRFAVPRDIRAGERPEAPYPTVVTP